MSNNGFYKWCFKKDQHEQFLKDNEYKTEQFTIAGFKWAIDCAPKNGYFTILLTLISQIPPDVDHILVQHNHKCIDTFSSLTLMNEYDKQNKSWGANGEILSLQQLQNTNDKISFQVNIKIIQIVTKNKVLFIDRLRVRDQYTINWKVGNELMGYFKTAYNGQLFESLLESDSMFVIRCCPNGYDNEYKGKVSFGFRMIHWPFIDAKKYRIKFILSCNGIDILKPYEASFSVETPLRGWSSIDVNFEHFIQCIAQLESKHETLNIKVNYEILEYTDNYNNKVSKLEWDGNHLQNNVNNYNQCLQSLNIIVPENIQMNENVVDSTQEDIKIKEEKESGYDNDIINMLVNAGIGSKDECIAASKLVNNPNDINEVLDKVSELKAQQQYEEVSSISDTNNKQIDNYSHNNEIKIIANQIDAAISHVRALVDKEDASNFFNTFKQKLSGLYDVQVTIRENKYECIDEIYKRINNVWSNMYSLTPEELEQNRKDIERMSQIEAEFSDLMPEMNKVNVKVEVSEQNNASNHNQKNTIEDLIKKKQQVKEFLDNIKLPQYYETFISSGFDDMEFITGHITKDDLDAIGITKYGHRKRILDFANGLYNKKRALEDEVKLENENHNNNEPPKKKQRID